MHTASNYSPKSQIVSCACHLYFILKLLIYTGTRNLRFKKSAVKYLLDPNVCVAACVSEPRQNLCLFNDIAGAFDRVDMKKLITKFKHLGGCDAFVDLLASCFAPRSATIAAESKQLSMENIISRRIELGICGTRVSPTYAKHLKQHDAKIKIAYKFSTFKKCTRNVFNEKNNARYRFRQASEYHYSAVNRVTFELANE